MNLTLVEAYIAMLFYLKSIYEKTKSDDLGAVLGDLDLVWVDNTSVDSGVWNNRWPGDPAVWNDWLKCVAKVKPDSTQKNSIITVKEAYKAMFYFVEQLYNLPLSNDIQNIFKDLNTTNDGTPINEAVKKNYLLAVNQAKSLSQ